MISILGTVFALLLLFSGSMTTAGEAITLPLADDWAAEATQARQSGIPIMVVFSADHCFYCERMKAEVLTPQLQQGLFKNRVRVREFNIDAGGKITDFDGEPIRGRIFVTRYNVFATPTVVLVDYRGKLLTSPLIGFDNSEDYANHLDRKISNALDSLATSPRYVMGNQPE